MWTSFLREYRYVVFFFQHSINSLSEEGPEGIGISFPFSAASFEVEKLFLRSQTLQEECVLTVTKESGAKEKGGDEKTGRA